MSSEFVEPEPNATLFANLNDEQRRAVTYGVGSPNGTPLLIIAGAGTGKTYTLAHRVSHLVASGVDPNRILLLTFSRRAASEMSRQVALVASKISGPRARLVADGLAWSGTFHAMAARVLRNYALAIGLDPSFTIMDREDASDLMNLVRSDLGFAQRETRFPTKANCLAIYSHCVNAQQSLERALAHQFVAHRDWTAQLRQLFAAYVEAKQRQNLLDYDDLLLFWAQALQEETLSLEIGGRFDHVLIDEYQDTNRLQAAILLGLKPHGHGLTAVGDDAQSIYSFRCATVRNILDFPDQFKPRADVIALERNYRSTQPLLAAANRMINLAKARFTKNLWTDRPGDERPKLVSVEDEFEAARYVAATVLENLERGVPLSEQAALFRASQHSAPLELELARRHIPFRKFGGLRFVDAAHIKDLVAFLRFVANPQDRVSGLRLLLLIPGSGPAAAQRILSQLQKSPDPLRVFTDLRPESPNREWSAFVTALTRAQTACWPLDLAIARSWYEPLLDRLHDRVQSRRADLRRLDELASAYPSRERFLTEIALDPIDAIAAVADQSSQDPDRLTLSTIHSAKGQEWRCVYILNAIEGALPLHRAAHSPSELEEERRLLYVAMTRAKESLHVLTPRRFASPYAYRQNAGRVGAARTRFIPDDQLALFEQMTWPAGDREEPFRDAWSRHRIDVAARARAIWR